MSVSNSRDWSDDRAVPKLKEYIKRKLGDGVVCVELTEEQLDDAIRDAEEFWMQWVGREKIVDFTFTGAVVYPADSIASDIDSITNVYFDVDDESLRDVFGWAGVEINPFQTVYQGRGGYASLVQLMQYRENAQRIVSADKDWGWNRANRTLEISPKLEGTRRVKILYQSRSFDYNYLATYEWHLFRDYALAKSMRTLGLIRMKYAELPSATGGFSMDGDSLWSNAEMMEMSIEDKMRNMQRPTGFWVE
jgi:hypothetical protein